MGRSYSVAAYLGRLVATGQGAANGPQSPHMSGPVIWVRCSDPAQLAAVDMLDRKLREDGDPVHVIATLTRWNNSLREVALPEPLGKANIRAFIADWKPVIVVWMRGNLDPAILREARAAGLRTFLVDATIAGLDLTTRNWMPGVLRTVLSRFDAVLTLDQTTADRLIRAGARADVVQVTGSMEDCAPPLPCDENQRQALSAAIMTRPVWLAAGADLDECVDLCTAHVMASRRAHRLLLIIVPRVASDGIEFAARMRAAGLHVALRSHDPAPTDPMQAYVVDTAEDLGLWYRISPITYLGGTLHGAPCRDAYEAAALGSVVVYGARVTPYEKHAARLHAAGASCLIRSADDLGHCVEKLLAPDKAAQLAHAAWDVTSRGADVTNRIAGMIQRRLAELGF